MLECGHIIRTLRIQQVQFWLIIVQCSLGLYNDCDMPRQLVYVYIPNVLFIFYMFYKFFNRAYTHKQSTTADDKVA